MWLKSHVFLLVIRISTKSKQRPVLLLANRNHASAKTHPRGTFIKIIAADRRSDRPHTDPQTIRPTVVHFGIRWLLSSLGSPLIIVFHPKSLPLGSRAVLANQEWLITIGDASYMLTGEPVKCPCVITQVIWCHSFRNSSKRLHARPRSCFCFLTICKIKLDNSWRFIMP